MSFSVERGELVTLLGPSGCGKTTTLRMVAGFEYPDSGDIRVNGQSVVDLAPQRRPVGFVFQQYSLFPHMTVFENVAFGLKARKVPKAKIKEKVTEALRVVRLQGYEGRAPTLLSGGQQQRVALARVLVTEPELILLDEPFGALDRKLRDELQAELKELMERLSVTAVFVTHDQDEALLMSNRVVVMSNGRIEQLGSPQEVYERPATTFVASFVGTSNQFEGPCTAVGPHTFTLTHQAGSIHGTGSLPAGVDHATAVIRPEKVVLSTEPVEGDNWFPGRLGTLSYTGNQSGIQVELDSGVSVVARQLNTHTEAVFRTHDRVWVHLPIEHVRSVSVSG
ncbi:MAG: ABC transporter ATP-binding protein [Nocardioidaceae bacterium]